MCVCLSNTELLLEPSIVIVNIFHNVIGAEFVERI